MVVILFRSHLTPEAGTDYKEMAMEMLATAKDMPGFVDFKTFTADDGERISIVRWQDLETLAAWRNHPRHLEAKKSGRAKWYQNYKIEIAEVVRESGFEKPAAVSAALEIEQPLA